MKQKKIKVIAMILSLFAACNGMLSAMETSKSEKNSKIITKYASININKNSNNKTNKNSKMKIKGIQIKNFNKIFNLNKEKSNDNFIKTSERSKKSNFNIINTKKMLLLKNTTQNKTKNLNSVNNLISYTEREKAKRIFFSNKI